MIYEVEDSARLVGIKQYPVILHIVLTVTRILDCSLTSSRRRPSVSAVTACFVVLYMAKCAPGGIWPSILWVQNASTYK